MHEMSIALSIVDIANEEVANAGGGQVSEIILEIGQLSGVIVDALDFVWSEAVKDSVLEKAARKILLIPGKAGCMNCENEFEIHDLFDSCPVCNSNETNIIKGKELRIKSLIVY